MIPERFTYESVDSDECLGEKYIIRKDRQKGTEKRVAYSHLTDPSSIYVLKTVDKDDRDNKYNRYWDFGDGWDHLDDFLYNGAVHIFRGFDEARYFEVMINIGRVKRASRLSTETYEQSISLLVPPNLQELDVPGIAGEASTTGDADPVMFNSIKILNELYWVMKEFSSRHTKFQSFLDGEVNEYSLDSNDSLRAYRAVALAYPFFEGLVTELVDRVDLKSEPYEGTSGIQFKYLESNMPQAATKTIIQTLEESRGTINEYERDFLVETFYDESVGLGVSRNDLAHNLFDATRGFQKIDWYELARRLIVSIAFLDEKVVCTYSDLDSADLTVFEKWLTQRENMGFDDLQNTV